MTVEALPRPKAIDCVAFVDPVARSASVRPGDEESGYAKQLWRDAWLAQRRSHERGWPASGAPWVYADVPGAPRVVHGVPGEGGVMVFTWPTGVKGFAELVGRPGLRAVVTVDIGTRQLMGCKFLHGRAG